MRKLRKVLFLDRDDTIVKDCGYMNHPDQIRLLPGLVKALKLFRDEGYEFIVTTNQSGLTRGLVEPENLVKIHRRIQDLLNLQGIRILDFYYAPYTHEHKRRKPGIGLTLEAFNDYAVDPRHVVFAGDKWRDIAVSKNYPLSKTILVNEAPNQRAFFQKVLPNLILDQWLDLSKEVFKSFLYMSETQCIDLKKNEGLIANKVVSLKSHSTSHLSWKNN